MGGGLRLGLVAGIIGTFMGFIVKNAVAEKAESHEESGDDENCDYEDEDLSCFPHITHDVVCFNGCWLSEVEREK